MTILLRVGACKWIILAGAYSGHYDSTVVFLSNLFWLIALETIQLIFQLWVGYYNRIIISLVPKPLFGVAHSTWYSKDGCLLLLIDLWFWSSRMAAWSLQRYQGLEGLMKQEKEIPRWCAGCVSNIRHAVWRCHNYGNIVIMYICKSLTGWRTTGIGYKSWDIKMWR